MKNEMSIDAFLSQFHESIWLFEAHYRREISLGNQDYPSELSYEDWVKRVFIWDDVNQDK